MRNKEGGITWTETLKMLSRVATDSDRHDSKLRINSFVKSHSKWQDWYFNPRSLPVPSSFLLHTVVELCARFGNRGEQLLLSGTVKPKVKWQRPQRVSGPWRQMLWEDPGVCLRVNVGYSSLDPGTVKVEGQTVGNVVSRGRGEGVFKRSMDFCLCLLRHRAVYWRICTCHRGEGQLTLSRVQFNPYPYSLAGW